MTDLYGCGDHGCIYGHPGGMGTNGGCDCRRRLVRAAGDDGRKAVRQILALRAGNHDLRRRLDQAPDIQKIYGDADMLMRNWCRGGARGQVVTERDTYEYWVVQAAWAEARRVLEGRE